MINYFELANNQFSLTSSLTSNTIWLSVEKPSLDEVNQLIRDYELPKDYITSILDDNENARFEGLEQNKLKEPTLLLLQYPHNTISPSGYTQLMAVPFAIILTKDKKIITVTNHTADFINQALNEKIPDSKNSIQSFLVLFLSWQIAIRYNQCLKELIKQTNTLEGELNVSTENNQLYQMMNIEKSLVYFESAINANLTVITMLYQAQIFNTSPTQLPALHDILVEIRQAATTTSIQLKLVNKISDTFSAIVSNNLNNVMKILTSLTIVLTIPTIIGGIYGMNVKLPFENREDAFWWIFILTTGTCIFVIHKLRKKNLL